MGWLAALMAGLIVWLGMRDLRSGETGGIAFSARRRERPIAYWAVMTVWLACLLFCVLIVIGNVAMWSLGCDYGAPCTVTVKVTK